MVQSAKRGPLSDSLQDYLEAVYLVAQRHGVARMKEIASLVGVGKSSVTGAVQSLAERGLVNYDPYQYVTLTEKGEAAGRDLARRHRILKEFLMKVLTVPEAEAERVACKMEHAIKGEVFGRFLRFLEFMEGEAGPVGSWAESFRAFCVSQGGCDGSLAPPGGAGG
ncbi:MAG: metal-dependent transcriptional regulator [Phycisphaerae bacterium]|nr:metal-dependent transcriptional regulator [Phycisphaerae bacterium]